MKLVKTDIGPFTEQRALRMHQDAKKFAELPDAEVRAIYCILELARDELSKILDRVDGK